ncbi:HNH endonuclease [Chloroflexota bacterium]
MSRHWGRNSYTWAYCYLALRDGDHCIICRARPPKAKLEIDHIDGNTTNNNRNNLCLLCKKHNCEMRGQKPSEHKRIIHRYSLLNEREKKNSPAMPATQFTKEVLDYQSGSVEMQANSMFETHYREWIMSKVTTMNEFLKEEAINAGAELVGCSPLTTRRYLQKLTSSNGPLYETKDAFERVVLRFKRPDQTGNEYRKE